MNELIASFLVQQGECRLAGIGRFEMHAVPAVSDVASKVIFPPEINFVFKEESNYTSEELIAYTAYKMNTDFETAGNRIQNWINTAVQQLNNREAVYFPAVGKLIKNGEDITLFQAEDPTAGMLPVAADRVIHEKDTHKVLVGDVESDSEKMNQLLHTETAGSRPSWWKAALIIFIITVALYIVYLFAGGFGLEIHLQDAPATYISK